MSYETETLPSRAGSLALIANNVALDFANTCSGLGTTGFLEHLHHARHVVMWARHAEILSEGSAQKAMRAVTANTDTASRLLRDALNLRSAIQSIGGAVVTRSKPNDEALAFLAQLHVACLSEAALSGERQGFAWRWISDTAVIESILGPITVSAIMLLTEGDLSRVKRCGGQDCGWLFCDTTKNKSRRWCEMEVCGNREKQKRLQRRKSASSSGT